MGNGVNKRVLILLDCTGLGQFHAEEEITSKNTYFT